MGCFEQQDSMGRFSEYSLQFSSTQCDRQKRTESTYHHWISDHQAFLRLDDRETIAQIRENAYLQYFIGLETFMTDPPFDSSLFVEIRHKLTPDLQQRISEKLFGIIEKLLFDGNPGKKQSEDPGDSEFGPGAGHEIDGQQGAPTHKGDLMMDA